ncbi:hypothetical protein A2Z00_03505 [Candidatus Gottesmanbacteria bacterium RBG_13_45_10]|uniref:General secretion pathway GspH domain-containing protein n=1 Tax=Candidatus Gottesmanbacteria bacterium RBG_13_45_10 TaxID=1798370 RepID=A0A1F5ZG57_9BACT|nr:MAG: hypothetical protein A2Z00_03505 [Candidatus Gottesmanbacteria bacterium RBG_13_45_10]
MKDGFTLIELIVAVTISLVVTGVIIANYNTYSDNQALKQAALTLKNDFRFAQGKASAGLKPTEAGVICTTLNGWTVTFTVSAYTLQANCVEGAVGSVTTMALPTGLSFALPLPPAITFKVLASGTTLAASQTVTLVGRLKNYAIQVTPSGDINDLGFQ